MRPYVLLAAVLAATPAAAQVPGDCQLGLAGADLDVGDVRATVFNTGSLFFAEDQWSAYEVPRGSGRSPWFAAGLWVAAEVGGQVRMAGSTYDSFEFWPGPLEAASGRPPDPGDCSSFDRIWRVSRHEVAEYYRTGVAALDLLEWPAHLGAPVLDGDGDIDNYDLAAGDQPAIRGDQMLWWVMNDVGNEHSTTGTAPIGLEVHVEAFAFGGGSPHAVRSTFYRYTFHYRGDQPIEAARYAIWTDPDLGDAADDYVGIDTTLDLAIAYNADNQDGAGLPPSYGEAPPAVGVDLLTTGASAFRYLIEVPTPTGDPFGGSEMYQTMLGRWNDGTPITVGGGGYNPGWSNTTTFTFAGDPVTGRFWSERCPADPTACGSANQPGDRRFLISSSLGFRPDEPTSLFVAFLYARGADNLNSIEELRRASAYAQNAHDVGFFEPERVPGFVSPAAPLSIQLRRPAPNPFTDAAAMSITLPAVAGVRVALVDVLGREVAVLADGPHEAGVHPITIAGAGLAPGVYLARVWVAGQPAGALPVTRR